MSKLVSLRHFLPACMFRSGCVQEHVRVCLLESLSKYVSVHQKKVLSYQKIDTYTVANTRWENSILYMIIYIVCRSMG